MEYKTKQERRKIYFKLLENVDKFEIFFDERQNIITEGEKYICWKLNVEVYGYLKLNSLGKFDTDEMLALFPEFKKAFMKYSGNFCTLLHCNREPALIYAISLC